MRRSAVVGFVRVPYVAAINTGGDVTTYQADAFPSARTDPEARREELKALMAEIARHLLPCARTAHERQRCSDVARGRYDWATLHVLLDLAARSETPNLVSDRLRAIEDAQRGRIAESVLDASEREQQADAALDFAQLQLARELTPVRAAVVVTLAAREQAALRDLVAAAERVAHAGNGRQP